MSNLARVLDDIDALVDEQLEAKYHARRSDHCPHCFEDWHALPIRKRMRDIRALWQSTIAYYEDEPRASPEAVAELNAYNYNEDTSPVLCPGSDFIGPIPDPYGSMGRYRLTELALLLEGMSEAMAAAVGLPVRWEPWVVPTRYVLGWQGETISHTFYDEVSVE